jgi:hypothetical protein
MPNAVLVKFTKHGSPLTVKDLSAAAVVDREFKSDHAGKFLKKLMDGSKQFKTIHSKLNEAYGWHKSYTMPFLDNGMRMLNVEKLDDYLQQMNTFKSELQRLLIDLKPEWDSEVTKDMAKLAGLANPKDYPQWGEIEYRYAIDVKILPVPEAQDFRFAVDQNIINELSTLKEQAKIEGRKEVFGKVEKLVSAAIIQCRKEKGKIYDSLLGNMKDQAELIQYLNIHNDAELAVVGDALTELSESVTTFNLRNDPVERINLANRCDEFITRLRSGNFTTVTSGVMDPNVVDPDIEIEFDSDSRVPVEPENSLSDAVV